MNRLIDLFDFSLKNHKNKVAITNNSSIFTYQDIDVISKLIATKINQIYDGSTVSIYGDEKLEFLFSVLGTLRSGKIFCAIPKNNIWHPEEYINITNSSLILTSKKGYEQIKSRKLNANYLIVEINQNKVLTMKYVHNNFVLTNNVFFTDEDILYVYFTSGTTDTPKAILGSDKGLCHFINWQYKLVQNSNIVVAQMSSPWFDPYLREIFLPLCFGGTIAIPRKNDVVEINRLVNWLNTCNVSILNIVPTIFRKLFLCRCEQIHLNSLKYIFFAGEMLFANDIINFRNTCQGNIKLYNLYGPSETTLAKFYYEITSVKVGEKIPVGVPLPNTHYELDDNTNEVIIETEFASHGYIIKDHKKATGFSCSENGIVRFFTGDIGEVDNDGILYLKGRKNNVVKYRGEKVNLEAIEGMVCNFENIKQCIVCVIGETEPFLVAAIVYKGKIFNDTEEHLLKSEIALNFSSSLVPKHIIIFDTFPTNCNGKIDRLKIKKEICEILKIREL